MLSSQRLPVWIHNETSIVIYISDEEGGGGIMTGVFKGGGVESIVLNSLNCFLSKVSLTPVVIM